jgi:PAS domain S-box-containing protein
MPTPSPQELAQLLHTLAQNLSTYEATEANLQEKLRSIEQELSDRTRILDRFVLLSETDTRGVITYANAKFCEVSGYSREELIGKPHNIVRHPDTPREVFQELWDTIKAGKIWQGEIKNRRKDGSAYWVLATVGPLLDTEGYPYRYVSMRVDITDQKELEAALQQERNRLAADLQENLTVGRMLQEALMPFKTEHGGLAIGKFPSLVWWKPAQVVSGDFLWAHEEKGRLLLFVGDSIGHGIAGGLVTALFIQELRHLVIDKGLWSPERLAEELDERLGTLFRRQLPHPITVDGTILLLDYLRQKLSYVALRGKGVLLRKEELIPFERYPFSFGELLGQAAQEQILPLHSTDRLYLYTDGVTDQLIPAGQKCGTRRWQEALQAVQAYPFQDHAHAIEAHFTQWQGSTPQTDDLLVVGIEIP